MGFLSWHQWQMLLGTIKWNVLQTEAVKPWIVNYYVPHKTTFSTYQLAVSIMFCLKLNFLSSSSCVANKTNFIWLPSWLYFLSFRIFPHIFQYIYLNYLFFSLCFKICERKIILFLFFFLHIHLWMWFGGDV